MIILSHIESSHSRNNSCNTMVMAATIRLRLLYPRTVVGADVTGVVPGVLMSRWVVEVPPGAAARGPCPPL